MKIRALLFRFMALAALFIGSLSLANCSKPACYYDVDCQGLMKCVDGRCQLVSPLTCKTDADCKGKKCVENQCVTIPKGYEFPQTSHEMKEENVGEKRSEALAEQTGREVIVSKEEKPHYPDAGEENLPEQLIESLPEKGSKLPCSRNDDCQSLPNTVCRPDFSNGGKLFCLPENSKGKKVGESCDPDKPFPGDCKSGLCRPDTKRCTQVCLSSLDCPSGYPCEHKKIKDNAGKEYDVQLCFSGGNQCLNDADCAQKQGCLVTALRTGRETRCGLLSPTAKEMGKSCTTSIDCQHTLCIDANYCSAPCKTEADCPKNYLCKIHQFNDQGVKSYLKICMLPDDGLPCLSDGDCSRTNYFCQAVVVQKKVVARCEVAPGNAKSGDSCKKDSDCRSGICLKFTQKCSNICKNDQDCPTGLKCQLASLRRSGVLGKVKICLTSTPSCATKATACSSGQVCTRIVSDSGEFKLACVAENSKGKVVGAVCQQHSDCKSQFCYAGRCTKPCYDDVKLCPQGYVCQKRTLSQSGYPDITASLCLVPNTGITCSSDKVCTPGSGAEYCRVIEKNGQLRALCSDKTSGTKKTGEACTKDEDCIYGTCLPVERICSKRCKDASDCSKGKGLACVIGVTLYTKAGKAAKFDMCAHKRCHGDADCGDGERCVYKEAGGKFELVCEPENKAKKRDGVACSKGSECQSGLCHPKRKICVGVCRRGKNADCRLQYYCEKNGLGPHSLRLCLPVDKACRQNSDCAKNELCTLSFDKEGRPQRVCDSVQGSKKIGELCDPTRTDECRTGLCDPITKQCSEFCSSSCPVPYDCLSTKLKNKWPIQLCRRCRYDGDCDNNKLCQVSNFNTAAHQISTTCVDPKVIKKKKNGELCDPTKPFPGECASGLCSQQGFCAAICLAHRHCAKNYHCAKISVSGTFSTFGCVAGPRSTCLGDADCLGGKKCIVVNVGGRYISKCETPLPNKKKVGESCDPNKGYPGDCESQLCDDVTKKCLKICHPLLGDCPSGQACSLFSVGNSRVYACVVPPKACKKQSDCLPGTTCRVDIVGKRLEYLCLRTPKNAKDVGQSCFNNSECKTGICHPQLNVCLPTCSANIDCHNKKYPLCGKVELGSGLLARACLPNHAACTHDAVCPASQPVCSLDFDQQGNIIRKCVERVNSKKKIGETCADSTIPGDCQNHFCEAGRARCTATCTKDAHCPKGLVCGETFVEGNKKIKGCIPPVGTACRRKIDCAAPTVCRASRTSQGIVTTCQVGQGVHEGENCDPSKSIFQSDCATRLCDPKHKVCVETCKTDADCLHGFCKSVTIDHNTTKVCQISCTKEQDCPKTQHCALIVAANTLKTFCSQPLKGNKKVGDTCDTTKNWPGECETGICSQGAATCSQLCSSDADCPKGMMCSTTYARLSASFARLKGCVPLSGGCFSPDGCPDYQYLCRVEKYGTKLVTNCVPYSVSGRDEGNPCDPNKGFPGDCKSRLCDPKSKECTVPCKTDKDCVGHNTRLKCRVLKVQSLSISACVKP